MGWAGNHYVTSDEAPYAAELHGVNEAHMRGVALCLEGLTAMMVAQGVLRGVSGVVVVC